ncbi:MAG: hypothetical protein GQ527_07145 [Bacteroidales bacterium]|nr:hypothetical protein [Bacteroidales bacterium]
MAYKIGTDIDDWLLAMEGKMNFGCAEIPQGDLPLSNILFGKFAYVANEPLSHLFVTPLEESEAELVLYRTGSYSEGAVTLLVTELSRFGFTVKAPVDCQVDYVVGYETT